jgi:hypothetical protein
MKYIVLTVYSFMDYILHLLELKTCNGLRYFGRKPEHPYRIIAIETEFGTIGPSRI